MNLTTVKDVRIGGPADLQELHRLCLGAHAEIGLFPVDHAKVDWLLMRMVRPYLIDPGDTGTRGVIGVLGKPERLEGFALLVLSCLWYTSQPYLAELGVYVEPDYRSRGHHKALIHWMKQQSAMTGLPLMTGIMTTHRTEAKVRLYEREIPKIGAVFRYDPLILSSSGASSVLVH